jgi:hypothetical protein
VRRAIKLLEREIADAPNFIRVRLELAALLARHDRCDAARKSLAVADASPAVSAEAIQGWHEDARRDVSDHCPAEPTKPSPAPPARSR